MNTFRYSPTSSSSISWRKVTLEVIVFLCVLLFVYAAISKLTDVQRFRLQIGQSPMLTAYAAVLSWAVPIIEIVIALMLTIPKLRLAGLYSFFGMMLTFTAYIFAILNFADYIPCSCGGILESLQWSEHLIFNLLFVALAIAAIYLTHHPNQPTWRHRHEQ